MQVSLAMREHNCFDWFLLLVLCSTHMRFSGGNLDGDFRINGTYSAQEIENGLAVQFRDGDILLGSLIPQHSRVTSTGLCGNITSYGVQALETLNMLLDKVNANDTILPGVKLGMISIDTCGADTHAVRMTVRRTFPLFWQSNTACMHPNVPTDRLKEDKRPFAGFIGAVHSDVTILVAKILQVFNISQISFWSTNPEISNKKEYATVFRTVPSDAHQAQAMLDFVKMNDWNYISVVYSNSFYGSRAFQQIRSRSKTMGICIVHELSVKDDAPDSEYDDWMKNLVQTKARVVIIFTGSPSADRHPVLRAAWKVAPRNFTWIGSDGFTESLPDNWRDYEHRDEFKGVVGFQPKAKRVVDLDIYLENVALKDRLGSKKSLNPWFAKYFEQTRNCTINVSKSHPGKCNTSDHLTISTQSPSTQYISDAFLAYVHALDNLHKDICNGTDGLCNELKCSVGSNLLATKLFPHLQNVSFQNAHGDRFQFDKNQDGPIKYDLLTLTESSNTSWVPIGQYINGRLDIHDKMKLKKIKLRSPSVCSEKCQKNEKIVQKDNDQLCCWDCIKCDENSIVSENGTQCVPCGDKEKPDDEFLLCVAREVRNIAASDVRTVIPVVVSTLGILTTAAVIVVYVINWNTPIVKACSKELSVFVFIGVLLCLASGYVMAAGVTMRTCATARSLFALGPAFMYSGLLTKTVRIVIIFQSKTVLKSYMKAYIKSMPQVVSTAVLVGIQAFVLTVWFLVSPNVVISTFTDSGDLHYDCGGINGPEILIGLAYPSSLILTCTVLATVNRHVPIGFRETRYIGFTMYTTCVIWLAFSAIVLSNPTQVRLQMMTKSLCLSLSALTVVAWMFIPRCYDILFHPERNTRDAVMDSSVGRSRSKSDGQVVLENNGAQHGHSHKATL